MGTKRRRIRVTEGSGNVFADVGIERPKEYLAKAELARQIVGVLDARGVTQPEAARLLGLNQPKVSALRNGRLDGFLMDRLIRFLNTLGRDVSIVVSAKPRSRGRARHRVTSVGRALLLAIDHGQWEQLRAASPEGYSHPRRPATRCCALERRP